MEPIYQIYPNEIGAKGKAYLAVRRCRADDLEDVLRRGREKLLSLGAAEIYVTCSDPAAPLEEGQQADCRLVHVRDMLWMERELTALPPGGAELDLVPLTRERGGAWLTLHNESFFDAPNSATYGPQDLETALEEGHRCGFAQYSGVPVGIYELNLTGELPEIEGIALQKNFRGKGLGRALLVRSMEALAALGYGRCRLMVATDNAAAFALYRSAGFRAAGVQSRWFQMLGSY